MFVFTSERENDDDRNYAQWLTDEFSKWFQPVVVHHMLIWSNIYDRKSEALF